MHIAFPTNRNHFHFGNNCLLRIRLFIIFQLFHFLHELTGVSMLSPTANEIILYQSPDGSTHLEVSLYEETVWLAQSHLVELFDVKVPAISKHVQNILRNR